MPLVTSLLTAIVRADGDALVLHAGERPYVVAPTGQTELASRTLTLDAMKGMLGELLSADAERALHEFGAVQHKLSSPGFAKNETFSVIAARGGDDIWIEIRRHRAPVVAHATVASTAPVAPSAPIAPIAPVAPIAPSIADSGVESTLEPDAEAEVEIPLESALHAIAENEPELDPDLGLEPEPELEPELDLSAELEMTSEPEPAGQPVLVQEPESTPELKPDPEPEAWNIELTTGNLELEAANPGVSVGTSEEEPHIVAGALVDQIDEVEHQQDEDGSPEEIHDISLDADFESMADPRPPVAPPRAAPVEAAPPSVTQVAPVEPTRKPGPVEAPPAAVVPPPPEDEPEARPAVVLPLARTLVRARSGRPFFAAASPDGYRSPAPHRRGARRVNTVPDVAGASGDSSGRRDWSHRWRERAQRARCRGADPRPHPRAQPRGAPQPGGHRMDLRRRPMSGAFAASRSAIIAAPAVSSA